MNNYEVVEVHDPRVVFELNFKQIQRLTSKWQSLPIETSLLLSLLPSIPWEMENPLPIPFRKCIGTTAAIC